MVIETKRLILREYTIDDLEELYKILSCPITMSHYIKPYDYEGTKKWIKWCIDSYESNGFGLWAMILKETNILIGDCGLSLQNIDGDICPEIGYHIYKDFWRCGYGKEAANAVKEWAFNNTSYQTLYSYMTTSNVASYKTAESIGMKRIKTYTEDGIEHYVYSINKELK